MIYVLIPIFNRLELTKKCIESLKKQTIHHELEIVVVDDGSTDGTTEWLSLKHPDIKILKGSGGLFWGGAVHYGIEYLLKIGDAGDFILLVNNDVVVNVDSVERLRDYVAQNNRSLIAGALTVDCLDKERIIKSGTVVKNWLLNITSHPYAGERLSDSQERKVIEVDFLTGRSLLLPIEVFWVAGNYDSYSFLHYGCDDEFAMRVKRFGIKTVILPAAVVYLHASKHGRLGLKDTLFGIRSSSNLINKFKLSMKVAPAGRRLGFFIIGIFKSVYIFFKRSA
jgi:N-acetylglucosaminyl-diphospho-decaprenol L-rhamnosyltransferase